MCYISQSRGNNKQSGYVQIHERAEKIVEGIVDEFCLIFSFIKAVSLQLGRGVAIAQFETFGHQS